MNALTAWQGFLFVTTSFGYLETSSVDQPGLRFTEIHLFLLLEPWIKGVCVLPPPYFFFFLNLTLICLSQKESVGKCGEITGKRLRKFHWGEVYFLKAKLLKRGSIWRFWTGNKMFLYFFRNIPWNFHLYFNVSVVQICRFCAIFLRMELEEKNDGIPRYKWHLSMFEDNQLEFNL